MSLALGATLHATGIPPGALLVVFEVMAAWVWRRVALALYAEIVGLGGWARRLGLVAFFWGGGLLILAAMGYSLMTGGVIERIFRFDPSNGWWFLNFGRNLVFPTEALYHALFFGSVLCLLRRRFLAAAVLALVLPVSHPFSGIELLLILASWSAMELFFIRSTALPRAFFIAVVALLTFHVGYYLVYLSALSRAPCADEDVGHCMGVASGEFRAGVLRWLGCWRSGRSASLTWCCDSLLSPAIGCS